MTRVFVMAPAALLALLGVAFALAAAPDARPGPRLEPPAAAVGYGSAVALDGGTAVVGAWGGAGAAEGSGAAYVFERGRGGDGAWGLAATLVAEGGAGADNFGIAVALDGGTAVVGAWGVGDREPLSGSAYVFERDRGGPGAWGQTARLTASDGAMGDLFGEAVAISGDTIVVGAWHHDGVGADSGAAYVFERGAGGWAEVGKLTAGDAAAGARFGWPLAIDGGALVVGAEGADAAYVFERGAGGPGGWGQVARLEPWGDDLFGAAVAIDGGAVAVGAQGNMPGSGAAYVFGRDEGGPGAWGRVARLAPPAQDAPVGFGRAVAIAGDALVVGAPGEAASAGAAYRYLRGAGGSGGWGLAERIAPVGGAAGDGFGVAAALEGATLVVGADRAGDGDLGSAYVLTVGAGVRVSLPLVGR